MKDATSRRVLKRKRVRLRARKMEIGEGCFRGFPPPPALLPKGGTGSNSNSSRSGSSSSSSNTHNYHDYNSNKYRDRIGR